MLDSCLAISLISVVFRSQMLAWNALELLWRAIAASGGRFAAASHTLAEVLNRFGGDSNGRISPRDLGEVMRVLHRSIFAASPSEVSASRTFKQEARWHEGSDYPQPQTLLVEERLAGCRGKKEEEEGGGGARSSSSRCTDNKTIELVTVANIKKPELCELRRAAENLGYRLTILGVGEPWPGLGQKAEKLHTFLRLRLGNPGGGRSSLKSSKNDFSRVGQVESSTSIPGHEANIGTCGEVRCHGHGDSSTAGWSATTVVVFLDAFDILLLPTATRETLLRRFMSFQRPIVFGTESVSSPDNSVALVHPWRKINGNILCSFSSSLSENSSWEKWTFSDNGTGSTNYVDNGTGSANYGCQTTFLNSGTIIGYADSMLSMIEEILTDMKRHHGYQGVPIVSHFIFHFNSGADVGISNSHLSQLHICMVPHNIFW
jgi:hypothetical protein